MRTFIEQLEQEEIDDELYDQIVNFLLVLDVDSMPEDMQDQYHEIMEDLFGDDDMDPYSPEDADLNEEEELEEVTRKLKRTSPAEKAKRKRLYRKNKAKIKRAAKKRRKTASFKRYQKKAKRMAKRGKTSTGKRQTRRA